MRLHTNPLTQKRFDVVADVENLASKSTFAYRRREHKRDLRDQRRLATAAEALADFDQETAIYGFTKGQFSLIQMITASLEKIGPADLVISTWTAANADVSEVLDFCGVGQVTKARWLVDLSFSKRSPQLVSRIRSTFGDDAIRVAKNHAKFVLLGNADWRVVIHTSMNLNHNPRFENFEISNDAALYAFHEKLVDEIWRSQAASVEKIRPYEIEKHFQRDL